MDKNYEELKKVGKNRSFLLSNSFKLTPEKTEALKQCFKDFVPKWQYDAPDCYQKIAEEYPK